MAAKLAEKCTIMLDVGEGMMSRVSLLNRNLSSPGGRPHSLSNAEWAKLRKLLEKKFPEVNHGELSQQPGFETFQSAAGRIIDELGESCSLHAGCTPGSWEPSRTPLAPPQATCSPLCPAPDAAEHSIHTLPTFHHPISTKSLSTQNPKRQLTQPLYLATPRRAHLPHLSGCARVQRHLSRAAQVSS